jgi:menaquinone-dependent protoporphyrinogen oxidase
MKTLIVYGSGTGVTEDCAKELSKLLKDTELYNIKNKAKFHLEDFNTIIIGTSIHAGTINGGIKKFCNTNKDVLMKKTLGIYTCGLSEDKEALDAIEKGLEEELKSHAKVISHFGGEIRMDKLNFFFKFIIKKVLESKNQQNTEFKINKVKIKDFVNKLSK